MILDSEEFENYLEHYGTPRHSGRYPWGSGGEPIHSRDFLGMVEDLEKQGLSRKQIADGMGTTIAKLRARKSIALAEKKQDEVFQAQKLRDKGMSLNAIAERMGVSGESYVRSLLAPGAALKAHVLSETAETLKKRVDKDKFVQIGSGVENHLGIAATKLSAAVEILAEQDGYTVHTVTVPQIGTGHDTRVKVLCPPGTPWGEAQKNRFNIKLPFDHSDDGGKSWDAPEEPLSIDPDRIAYRFKEDGGATEDGVIYVRPGVEDVSIGSDHYAQVRIKVGDTHYLKGMAVYNDNIPEGKDLLFNSSKSRTSNSMDNIKKLTDDPDLPFGAVVRQIKKDGKVVSAMNIVNEEGKWDEWSRNLSSQMLSKQSPMLVKEQLDITFDRRQREFDEIMSLTNPTVKKKLLESFADGTDSAAVHLKAANMPRQATRVILPMNSMKPTEVYAPGFNDGETVVLIRFPHGGTFEIPELTVNNRHAKAKKLLGEARDVVGIHHAVAERLSGADFDGDTVLVIPNNHGKIRHDPALKELKNFDPKTQYAPYDGMKTIDGGIWRGDAITGKVDYGDKKPSSRPKGIQMGIVSNLITDMTIRLAPHSEIARAVKHSMVVIDAEKHSLDFKRSALENNIKELKEKYQGGAQEGASTLISKKKKEDTIPQRKDRPHALGGPIDPITGRRHYVPTNATKPVATGPVDSFGRKTFLPDAPRVPKTMKVKRLAEVDDAHELSSGTPVEKLYADHSNKLKALANKARVESLKTPKLEYSQSAAKAHAREVTSLDAKLHIAEKNAPLEKQAQAIANAQVRAKRDANPHLEEETLKKVKFQALATARIRMGAGKQRIDITDDEWNAIQRGAISNNKLKRILTHTDVDALKERAMPRTPVKMTATATRRAKAMLDRGYTRAEVAEQLGVSLSTLDLATNGEA